LGLTAEEQLSLADNSLKAAFMDEARRQDYRRVIKDMVARPRRSPA
jgi:adenosine deaminase